ncbi:uncharacterized protein LOC123525117 [Mercenaria mercenaria]|uniref:uncharacterized protein LOC123525117 n=1 Tax=Mercenaria mercenaria TaxID=6596 RepID=UPI00234F164B|nr:uncharacterized protein LOC123525117 [Mercenaria mercenaria]
MLLKLTLAFAICSTSFAFLESLFGHHGFNSNPDVVCIMEHCSRQSADCMGDANCRANMVCMMKCGMTNHSCMYECMNTYEDKIFDSFMKCLVDDYQCLQLVPPDPTFRCSPPTAVVKNFSLPQFKGSWYIALGLNRDYDCFDCQISSYAPTPNSRNYTLSEKYDVNMLNGTIRHRIAIQQVEQKDIFNGGNLDFTNTIMGLTMYEKWQVIDYAESGKYVIMYYCGHMTSDWWYEGNIVYSRTPTISQDDFKAIADTLETSLGHKVEQYCRPKTQNCDVNSTV